MRRDLLYKVAVGGMFLIGGLGIGVFLFSLFASQKTVSNPSSIVEETVAESQLSQAHIPKVPQAVAEEKETRDTLSDTDSDVTDLSVSPEGEESLTAQPSSIHSGEEPTTVRIKKLEAEYQEHWRKFVGKFRIEEEFQGLLKEHNGEGRRELIEELKRLQMLQIEARQVGQHDRAEAIKERSRQVNQDYGRYGKELVATINALQEEQEVIGEQMKAIQAELQSLRNAR